MKSGLRLDPKIVYGRRFGFGRTAEGDVTSLMQRLSQEIDVADASIDEGKGLLSTKEALNLLFERSRLTQQRQKQLRLKLSQGEMGAEESIPKVQLPSASDLLKQELEARIALIRKGHRPFTERIALFWSNHFTVSAGRNPVGVYAGAYDREAIRRNLFGHFPELVVSAVLHPAMLTYLDNVSSMGPNSTTGRARRRGLNENLAREVLELHTLGVDGGYTQADIVELAKALSGWTVDVVHAGEQDEARFGFDPKLHEPGERKILGRAYPPAGPEQAKQVLRDLAVHPSTARNVARRLAMHFVGSEASADLKEAMRSAFVESNGSLPAVYRALIANASVWQTPLKKFRPPIEFVLATATLFDELPRHLPAFEALRSLGQPYFGAVSPKGWPEEDNDAWSTASGLKARLDWSENLATQTPTPREVIERAYALFQGTISAATERALKRAESEQQRLTLFLMSVEMHRR